MLNVYVMMSSLSVNIIHFSNLIEVKRTHHELCLLRYPILADFLMGEKYVDTIALS